MASEDLNGSEPDGYVGPKVEDVGNYKVPDTPQDARLMAEIVEGIERKSDAIRRGDWDEVRAIDQSLTKAGWTSLRRAQANAHRSSRSSTVPPPPTPRPRSARPRRSTTRRTHRRRGPPSSDDSPEPHDVGLEPLGGLLAVELVDLARRIAEGR